jgi:hypothetical protein
LDRVEARIFLNLLKKKQMGMNNLTKACATKCFPQTKFSCQDYVEADTSINFKSGNRSKQRESDFSITSRKATTFDRIAKTSGTSHKNVDYPLIGAKKDEEIITQDLIKSPLIEGYFE